MAIYHCSCQVISRAQGRSAVGAAAYRSGTHLTNEYDGLTHDFTRKQGVVYEAVLLPENAPAEYRDRAVLWNEVEKIEKSSKAQLAREYEISIPRELEPEKRAAWATRLATDLFVKRGMCVDLAIHDKEADEPNPHVHIMVTMRPLDKDGKWESKTEQLYLCKNPAGEERAFTKDELALQEHEGWQKQHHYSLNGDPKKKKVYLTAYEKENNPKYAKYERIKNDRQPKTEKLGRQNQTAAFWNSKDFLQTVRAEVADQINVELERLGVEQRVDHRSLQDQGIDREPTIHVGPAATAMERRGISSDRGTINQEIKENNAALQIIDRDIQDANTEVQQLREELAAAKAVEAAKLKPEPEYSVEDIFLALREVCRQSDAFHDKRRPLNPAVIEAPIRLQRALDELEPSFLRWNSARNKVAANKWPWQKEQRAAASEEAAAAYQELSNHFDRIMDAGVSSYRDGVQLDVHNLSFDDVEYIQSCGKWKVTDLQRKADYERQHARPADAPKGSAERLRASEERFRMLLQNVPEEEKESLLEGMLDFVNRYPTPAGSLDAMIARGNLKEHIQSKMREPDVFGTIVAALDKDRDNLKNQAEYKKLLQKMDGLER